MEVQMKKYIFRNFVFIASLCFLTFLLTFMLVANMNDKVEKQLENHVKQLNIEKTERINKEIYYKEIENKYFEIMGDKKAEEIVKVYEEENARLQNTIKEWAALGVKPQNYQLPVLVHRGDFDREKMEPVGEWVGTMYCPDKQECSNNLGYTSSSKPVIPGTTIACDNRYWKYGERFYIEGIGLVENWDTGSAIKGRNRFDLCVFDKKLSTSGSFKAKVWRIIE
jgi:3D (Asp-Asp-Asp) domain-containing protein